MTLAQQIESKEAELRETREQLAKAQEDVAKTKEDLNEATSVRMACELAKSLVEKVKSQAAYGKDLGQSPEEMLKIGLVGAVSAHIKWDCGEAQELAADLCEDVNFHDLAKVIRDYEDE